MKKENREMHFKEIAKELNKIGENYSEHNVYSCIGRDSDNNFLQWNPGSYVIKEKMQYPVAAVMYLELIERTHPQGRIRPSSRVEA